MHYYTEQANLAVLWSIRGNYKKVKTHISKIKDITYKNDIILGLYEFSD